MLKPTAVLKLYLEDVFGNAINYISKWDAIPAIACPKDYVLARMGLIPNVVFLEGNGLPFCDHGFEAMRLIVTRGTFENQGYIKGIESRL